MTGWLIAIGVMVFVIISSIALASVGEDEEQDLNNGGGRSD